MSDKYTQDLEVLPGEPPQIAIFKNGLPMSYDEIEEDLDRLQAENERLKKIAACAYCGKEFKKTDIEKIADHATSCDKSPVVQMINELENKIKALEKK